MVALLLLTASLAAERLSFNNIDYLLLACEWSGQSAIVTTAHTVAERTTAERPLAMTSRRRPCERRMDTVEPRSSVLSQTRLATRRVNAPKPKGELKWGDGKTIVGTEIVRLSTSNALLNRTTHYLQTGDYGFNIPERAEIVGIEVHIEKKRSVLGHVEDAEVRLTRNGTLVGENRATSQRWPAENQVTAYGTPTDLWGVTFTPADINNNGFGVAISALMKPFGNFQTAEIGAISITAYWTKHRAGE